MKTQTLTLQVSDGTSMQAHTIFPEGKGPFPGILLIQEAFGVNGHIRRVGARLAQEGYAVIAPEMFHRSAAPGLEIPYGDFSLVMPHFQALTLEGMTKDLEATYAWLHAQAEVDKEKIGAIGFCLGGRVAFIANAVLPLQAAVSYYGGSLDQVASMAPGLSGAHLFVWGGLDKHITQEVRDKVIGAVTQAGKPHASIVFSYADHAFNCDDRPSFHPQAAKEAWALSMAFLHDRLGQEHAKK